MAGQMPDNMPVVDDFPGTVLDTHSVDWDFDRSPGTGGANVGGDFPVPPGRVIVEWSARETSCIRCEGGRDVRLVLNTQGPFSVPAAVHVGTRFKKNLNPTGPGASYTGTITMTSVPFDQWIKVVLEKYAVPA